MDFDFPPDTLMLRDLLRRFIQKEARPLEMKYFNTGALTPAERAHLRSAIEQLGLWGVTVPEKFGGGGLDTVTACLIEEELGHTIIPVELGDIPPLLFACAGEQIQRFLEPALAGERHCLIAAREPRALRPAIWTTTATADGDDFNLAGRKALAALPGPDDFFVVFAKTPEGLTAFLLAASHAGASAAANGEIILTLRECRVGREAMLGAPGGALKLGAAEAPRAWIRAGARYVGLAERLIEMGLEHAKEWVSLGAPLAARPAIQRTLAEMRASVESARWLVYHAAWLADKGEAVREVAAEVRLFTGQMLQRAIDQATMLYTGPGPSPQIEPRRLARSVVEPDALNIGLEYAWTVVAAEMLAADNGR
jgi:alkylation response protein AidB-like acyl-CoA dehydrogenase